MRASVQRRTAAALPVIAGRLLLAAALCAPQLVLAQDSGGLQNFPRRKAGLWEMRSSSAHAAGMPPTQTCVGDLTDIAGATLDRTSGAKGSCTLGAFKRAGLSWVAESVCKESRTSIVSKAVASGDFETSYRIDTVVTYDPPLAGVKKEDKEAVEATYIGPCTATQKPGDTVIPGMGTLNMIDGTFRAEPVATKRAPAQRPAHKAHTTTTN